MSFFLPFARAEHYRKENKPHNYSEQYRFTAGPTRGPTTFAPAHKNQPTDVAATTVAFSREVILRISPDHCTC
jgi:hypothetical protein